MLILEELEIVVLTVDLPEYHLITGDIGTVVLVHGEGEGYKVEFSLASGQTIAIVSLYPNQIRRGNGNEITRVRTYTG